MQSLEEKEHILCSNASILAGYDGAKVAYSKALGIFYLKNMNKDERDHYYYLTAQYHRDIMGETDKYGDNFKKLAVAPINKFTLEYTDYDHKEIEDSSWAAFYNNGSKDINIDMAYADASGENYHFQVETYSHELGHSYDHSIGSDKQFSLGTEEYADVFNQINKNDSEFEHIREYGMKVLMSVLLNLQCFIIIIQQH